MQLSVVNLEHLAEQSGFGWTVLGIVLLLLLASIVTLYADQAAGWFVSMNRWLPGQRELSEQRVRTLRQLYSSLFTILVYLLVGVAILRIFVDASQIVWIIGLFSAAFGLGARSLVSDVVAGATFIFRNTFAIGEKAEFMVGVNKVEGVVEDVTMRATLVRAPTGEIFTLPNGEIVFIRNFTRAAASGAQLRVRVPTEQLALAVNTLQALGVQSMAVLPEQLEPWQVLLVDDFVGRKTEITVSARFRFGAAAGAKPRLAALIYEGLVGAGVTVED